MSPARHKPLALLGRAEIALERGESADAAELADRYLRRFSNRNRIERCAGLEVAVRSLIDLGQPNAAEAALAELQQLAARAATRPLRAAMLAAQGLVGAARGDLEAGRRSLEDALDLLSATGAPFELARVRLDLAGVLAALGREERARREVEAALAALDQLGALGQRARGEALLARLGHAPAPMPQGEPPEPLARLSRREREVLVLVAEGLTNRDIGRRLVVSEHTVHRHVTSILRKLGLPSRAAAASLAARHGLA